MGAGHDKQALLSEEIKLLRKQSGNLKLDHPTSTSKWTTMLGRRISLGEKKVSRELRNIWEKSYYHPIECFAPNQLAVLIWK